MTAPLRHESGVSLQMIFDLFRRCLSEKPAGATDGYVVVDPGDVLVEEDLGGEFGTAADSELW